VVGLPVGAGAALLTPRLRSVALRTIDALISFPVILVGIFVTAIVGPGAEGAVIGIGVAVSFSFMRLASTLTLSIVGRDYIAAARVVGVRPARILFKYVLPNAAETLVLTTSISVASAIVWLSALSFLGLGVQPPAYDWGQLLTQGVQSFYETPAAALGPAVAIAITALAFGFTGEALARATNPVLWTSAGHVRARAIPNGSGTLLREARPDAPESASNGELTLQVRDLRVRFAGRLGESTVVDGISFDVGKGEIVGIVGESGSGKTMTAMAVADLLPSAARKSGTVKVHGKDLSELQRQDLNRLLGCDMAVVFQDPMSSLNPAVKLGVQMTEGVRYHRKLGRREATSLAVRRLKEVAIPAAERQLGHFQHQLSGGMRQRMVIAMGLMHEPALVIADEPTTSLDVTVQRQIMELFRSINESEGVSLLLISHNMGVISEYCHRVIVMYCGHIVEDGAMADVVSHPLHPYTQGLLAAVTSMEHPRDKPLSSIPGESANPADPPSGCPYHPRCPLAMARCAEERPPLVAHDEGWRVACWAAQGALR
jgi:peptide/nickel transport system permease protein